MSEGHTRAERMGRKTVRVAGLEANSVTADTSRQASRVTAQGGRPLMGSSCLPIHTDKPDTCTHPRNTVHVSIPNNPRRNYIKLLMLDCVRRMEIRGSHEIFCTLQPAARA